MLASLYSVFLIRPEFPSFFFTCDLRNQISASDGTKMWAESLQLARLGSRCMCLGFYSVFVSLHCI